MGWMVCITGEDFDLQEVSKSLTSPELSLIKEENQYYLKSTNFNQLNNANEVRRKAEEILILINGASKLALGTRRPVIIDSVIEITDDGKRQRNFFELGLEVTGRSAFSVTTVSSDGAVQEAHQADPIPGWIKIAQSNGNVAKVFRLLSKSDYDWANLYRIFEVIEEDIGGIFKITEEGWATEPAIRRFEHTANSVGAIGG